MQVRGIRWVGVGTPRVAEMRAFATEVLGLRVVGADRDDFTELAMADGAKLELFVINFMKDKMTLRVPTAKVANVGMRKLSEEPVVKKALETVTGRARVVDRDDVLDVLAAEHEDVVASTSRRERRPGTVLIDWAQNNERRTMVAP